MRRSAGPGFALAIAVVLAAPVGAQAQDLSRVDSLARIGDGQAAREALTAWREAEGDEADRAAVQRALWLEGLLTLRPEEATRHFRRLAVEFPGGPFTDQALLRLARYAFVQDRLAEAGRHFRTLARDHPGTPAALEAAEWLERHADAVAAAEASGEVGRVGRTGAGDGGGLDRQAQAARDEVDGRAAADSAAGAAREAAPDTLGREALIGAGADTTVALRAERGDGAADEADVSDVADASGMADTVEVSDMADASGDAEAGVADEPVAEAGDGTGDFTVQLGAFSTVSRARTLMERVREAGFAPRMVQVPGSDLIRVRIGRFEDAEGATRLYDRVRERGFEATVSGDAAREDVLR